VPAPWLQRCAIRCCGLSAAGKNGLNCFEAAALPIYVRLIFSGVERWLRPTISEMFAFALRSYAAEFTLNCAEQRRDALFFADDTSDSH
jgi:hypothetical protein